VASEPEAPRGRTWKWWWAAAAGAIVLAVVVGSIVGSSLGLRQGGPLGGPSASNGRPTIVVPTLAAAPSVASSPAPTRAATVVAAASPAPGPAAEYVVHPGDTLRSIAQQQYGDAEQWPKIYDANRDVIGSDPDALKAGTTLHIPPSGP
jgi:nucleoid-associated protein YgaU